jgi:hypothetical protein
MLCIDSDKRRALKDTCAAFCPIIAGVAIAAGTRIGPYEITSPLPRAAWVSYSALSTRSSTDRYIGRETHGGSSKKEPMFAVGSSTPLFQTTLPTQATVLPQLSGLPYDVTPDGKRFLLITPLNANGAGSANVADPVSITVIVDWRNALKRGQR